MQGGGAAEVRGPPAGEGRRPASLRRADRGARCGADRSCRPAGPADLGRAAPRSDRAIFSPGLPAGGSGFDFEGGAGGPEPQAAFSQGDCRDSLGASRVSLLGHPVERRFLRGHSLLSVCKPDLRRGPRSEPAHPKCGAWASLSGGAGGAPRARAAPAAPRGPDPAAGSSCSPRALCSRYQEGAAGCVTRGEGATEKRCLK